MNCGKIIIMSSILIAKNFFSFFICVLKATWTVEQGMFTLVVDGVYVTLSVIHSDFIFGM